MKNKYLAGCNSYLRYYLAEILVYEVTLSGGLAKEAALPMHPAWANYQFLLQLFLHHPVPAAWLRASADVSIALPAGGRAVAVRGGAGAPAPAAGEPVRAFPLAVTELLAEGVALPALAHRWAAGKARVMTRPVNSINKISG